MQDLIHKNLKFIYRNSEIYIKYLNFYIFYELTVSNRCYKQKLGGITVKDNQDKIQKLTDKYTKMVDDGCAEKEKEVLTV